MKLLQIPLLFFAPVLGHPAPAYFLLLTLYSLEKQKSILPFRETKEAALLQQSSSQQGWIL